MSAPATRAPEHVHAARVTGPSSTASWLSTPHLVGFLLLWAMTQLAAALVWYPDVLGGGQVDTDGYMRLVRVRDLIQGGAWYDPVIARSNAPYGEVMHWTRPLDILIAAVWLVLRPFMSGTAALAAAGAVISALCHAGVCVAAVWAIQPLVRGAERHFAMPAILAQTSLMAYGGLGRADHHMLVFLLFTLALGAWMRVLLEPSNRRTAFAAGALSGAGIWVGPETLLPVAVLFLSGACAWIVSGARYAGPNIRLCIALAAAIVAALVVERSPATWLLAEFDRISIAHLHVALIAVAFWLVAARTGGRSSATRAAAAAAGAVAAAAVLLLAHPRFFRGPWVDVDPAVIGVWLEHVTELQPAWPRHAGEAGRFVSMLGAAMLMIPFVAHWLWRETEPGRRHVWFLLLVSLLIYTPLATAQQRFSPYAGVVAAVAGIELLRRAFRGLTRFHGLTLSSSRVALILGVLLWPIIAGEALNAALPQRDESVTAAGGGCDLTAAALRLNDAALTGGQPRTIAAFIDFGPELLYRTPHHIVAGPYHRNRAGILDAHALLTSSDQSQARDIARRRGIDLILLCPGRDGDYFRGSTGSSIYAGLVNGRHPAWIREISFGVEGFRLFAVNAGGVAFSADGAFAPDGGETDHQQNAHAQDEVDNRPLVGDAAQYGFPLGREPTQYRPQSR